MTDNRCWYELEIDRLRHRINRTEDRTEDWRGLAEGLAKVLARLTLHDTCADSRAGVPNCAELKAAQDALDNFKKKEQP